MYGKFRFTNVESKRLSVTGLLLVMVGLIVVMLWVILLAGLGDDDCGASVVMVQPGHSAEGHSAPRLGSSRSYCRADAGPEQRPEQTKGQYNDKVKDKNKDQNKFQTKGHN